MRLLFVLLLLVTSTSLLAQTTQPKVIETHDLRSYHPENQGLKDLVFDVVIPELTDHLNKEQIFGKLKDVYFRVYWVFQGGVFVDVIGMPRGFHERKAILKSIIAPRLNFVIPQTVASMVRGYTFSETRGDAGETVLRGEDRTNMNYINRIHLVFSKEGLLKRSIMSSPSGEQTSEMEMKTAGWSNGKYILVGVQNKSIEGAQTITMDTNIKYKNVDGYGFPEEIETVTKQVLNQIVKDKVKETERELKAKVLFKNFQVNKGVAGKKLAEIVKEEDKRKAEEIKAKFNANQ